MDKDLLKQKAKDIALEIAQRPSIYMPIIKVLNAAALAFGWVRSLFRKD